MKISNNTNINFTAQLKKYIPVKHSQTLGSEYEDKDVSFVELNPYSDQDIKTLENISQDWTAGIFAENIHSDAKKIYDSDDELYTQSSKFYAITSQKNNLDSLDSNKILAICELKEENKNGFLHYIQVNPDVIYNPYFEYKRLGSAMLDTLKSYYDKIELYSFPSELVLDFYKRNKFRVYKNGKYYMHWEKESK